MRKFTYSLTIVAFAAALLSMSAFAGAQAGEHQGDKIEVRI
jgi:hypothetical protein